MAPISFDAATFEVLGRAAAGRQVCLVPRQSAESPRARRSTQSTPSHARLWLTAALFNTVSRRRAAGLVGGKAATDRRRSAVRAPREKRTCSFAEHRRLSTSTGRPKARPLRAAIRYRASRMTTIFVPIGTADRQHANLYSRSVSKPSTHRCGGRAAYWRRRFGSGLSESS